MKKRKPKTTKPKLYPIQVWVEEDLRDDIAKIGVDNDRTIPAMSRIILKEYAKSYHEK